MDDSLSLALRAEGRTTLPKEWKGKGSWVWVRAICHVVKSDGTTTWCVASYDGIGTKVVRDFGTASQVAHVLSIHPTFWLRPGEIPAFRTLEEIANYLQYSRIPPEETFRLHQEAPKHLQSLVFQQAVKIAESKAAFLAKYRAASRRKKGRK